MLAKFIVANPYEMPKKQRLIEFGKQEWFEGDEFTRPPGMSEYGFKRLISAKYIVEVK